MRNRLLRHTDPAATGIRPTNDVDAIVDVTSYARYTALADRLRALGLVEDTSERAPLCRWRHGHVIVDVMPTDPGVLGFSNQWYPDAIETAQTFRIAGHAVRIVTPALFLATKLEAFHGRGGDDILASHDLEDIIAVIDGRPEIVDDVAHAAADVRAYIASDIQALLDNPEFVEALAGFLLPDPASQARRRLLEERLRMISARSGPSRESSRSR